MSSSSGLASFIQKIQDVVITDILHVLPNFLKWYLFFIRRKITKCTYQKNILLYLHGKAETQKATAVLFLHGLYGHPSTLLPLAAIAQKAEIGPVFSLHLYYKPEMPQYHRDCLNQSINEIENIIQKNGNKLEGIIAIGHSMGGTEAAYKAFVEKDTRIRAVISIAGRLRETRGCNAPSPSLADQVFRGVMGSPFLPLFQITGKRDWCAPSEATIIRTDEYCHHIIDHAMHLNILYHKETHTKFYEYLKKSAEDVKSENSAMQKP